MRKICSCIVLFTFLLTGCGTVFSTAPSPTVIPITDILLDPGTSGIFTPTPFQPVPPTATPGINTNNVTETIPTENSQIVSPTTVDLGTPPKGQINILLLGSDWRPSQGYRTDVIMLLSLNPERGTASLTSFPRDLYIEIPGVGMSRINAAQEYGGFTLTAATFANNFDVHVDYYMMTNFNGFINIINTLGGINVYAAYDLYDECKLPQAVDKFCYIPAGMNTMNGETALWYVRSRHSSSDFDRTRRAQEVILAIFQKTMSLDAVNRSAELFDLFRSSVETNISLGTIVPLIPLGTKIFSNPSIVRHYAIGAAETYNYIVPETGAMVLIPDMQAVSEIIRQAIFQ